MPAGSSPQSFLDPMESSDLVVIVASMGSFQAAGVCSLSVLRSWAVFLGDPCGCCFWSCRVDAVIWILVRYSLEMELFNAPGWSSVGGLFCTSLAVLCCHCSLHPQVGHC